MGNNEEGKPSKTENSSSSATTDQSNAHAYSDWKTMQAYYGPRFAVPPYLNSAVASPHAPHPYMWAPLQSMMAPYGAPYAAFYGHGGVYAHPGVPIGGNALNMDTQVKSHEKRDGNFTKKSKEVDGQATSTSNGNGRKLSESDETEGSSDGSNGVVAVVRGGVAAVSGKKRSRQGSPISEIGQISEKKMETIPRSNSPLKTLENSKTLLELKDSCAENVKPELSMPNEAWLHNERELKRDRRKQSNRESARRSRLRKQAESEELAVKVRTLTSENMALKSEINKLMDNSKKLRLENATLMEKLKNTQTGDLNLQKIDDWRLKPVGTANLLARVDNNNDNSTERRNEEGDVYENRSSGAKLHQLLNASPRTDAVAAS